MTKKEERIRQVRRQKMILMAIGIGILLLAILVGAVVSGNKKKEKKEQEEARKQAQQEEKKAEKEEDILPDINVDLSELHSANAILLDAKTGKVLAEKNSEEKIYPASLTKIMTVLVGVENIKDYQKKVTIPSEIEGTLIENHASVAGFDMGEKVKAEDLFYGAILASGGDCCMTMAREVAGTEQDFLKLMNKKSEELGLENSHFADVTGFHHDDNYSTVKDIAELLNKALHNKEFYKVFTTNTYTTTATEEHPKGIELKSTLYKNLDTFEVTGGKILGGKTGYTESAGLCLASLADINGRKYILVTAKADGNLYTEGFHVTDAVNVDEQIGKSTK